MKVYVHGNCQAPALADLLAGACTDWEVSSRQVYSIDLERDRDIYLADVAEADLVLTQPVADDYRGTEILSTSWLRKAAKPGAGFLVFPVVYHRGQLPQCFTLAEFHQGRLSYHDAHALDFFLRGVGSDDFVAATATSDFLDAEFVQAELARTTLELLRREHAGGVDLPVSDIIASQLTIGQPLYTVNHPSRHVLSEIADRVLARAGRSERSARNGLDMLDRFVMPPYLSTALALGHGGQGLWLDDARSDGVIEKRDVFYREVFEAYDRIGASALRSAVERNPEINAYLNRFRHGARMSGAFDRGEIVDALYRVFFGRNASSDDILHHLQTANNLGYFDMIAAFPRSAEFRDTGAAQALAERFDGPASMPTPVRHYRIPHPVAAAPAAAPKTLGFKQRIRVALRVLSGDFPMPPATVGTPFVTDVDAATALQVTEGALSSTPAGASAADIDNLSEPDGLDASSELVETSLSTGALAVHDDDLLTIVIPMAGLGSRFATAGYVDPKPLIPVNGVPMIKLVIDNLRPTRRHRFVFVCQAEHIEAYGLNEKLEAWSPGCAIVGLTGLTEGAACTVLAARDHIGPGTLMIANSDQYIDVSIDQYLAAMNEGLDGLIMTMKADDPKWSFVATDDHGLVQRVAEKQVISNDATVGIYNFASGSRFLSSADAMIAKDLRVNGEFYVAPVYEELIAAGCRIGIFNVGREDHGMHGLGTPADLDRFLARSETLAQ